MKEEEGKGERGRGGAVRWQVWVGDVCVAGGVESERKEGEANESEISG